MTELCSNCGAVVNLCGEGVVKLSVMGPECWHSTVVRVWCDIACHDAEVASE